jgi:hypothetical protein
MRRILRFAVSFVCLVGCVLITAAWIRSHRIRDFYEWSSRNRNYQAFSNEGVASLTCSSFFSGAFAPHGGAVPVIPGGVFAGPPAPAPKRLLGCALQVTEGSVYVGIHYCSLLLTGFAAVSAPWLPWSRRFSLRTLLIATTALVVALAASAWPR